MKIDPKRLPTISVITPTLNCAAHLDVCLERIDRQNYPSDKVEKLVLDGGSTDDTVKVAQRYGARVIVVDTLPRYRIHAEARMAIGLQQSHHEIIAFINSDNFLPDDQWFLNMVIPFIEDKDIIATQTLRYAYRETDNLLTRYYSLLGVSDPVAYYLNKRDRISWFEEKWPMEGEVQDQGGYYRVKLTSKDLPPLGNNGSLIRKEILLKSKCSPDLFGHSDVFYDLAVLGYDTVGIVKNEIIHVSNHSFVRALKKRFVYFQSLYPGWEVERRYRLCDLRLKKDRLKLAWYIFISLTLVKPTWDALRGFVRVRDAAWFLHPVMCTAMTLTYGLAFLRRGWISLNTFLVSKRTVKLRGE